MDKTSQTLEFEKQAGSTTSILVVDDEPGVLRVCRRLLERNGYLVHTAADGREALELLEGDLRVDLLLCDVYMPGMEGDELAEKVRGMKPDICVVFISGHLVESQATKRLNIGKNALFLKKPFMGDELVDIVTQALEA